ncbi:MAG: NAD(P)-dependent oxidoreductase [Candidatus Promineifilaceae bacterium]|nr:NAD(P)-dependent oxidoreductase [Candidatus Promineifilaceae bacterium]
MRLLITGASGFIGRHLVASLVDSGEDVIALVKNSSDTNRFPPVLAARGDRFTVQVADLRDYRSTAEVIRRVAPSAIVHLAAAGVNDPFLEVRSALDHNLEGTLNLLKASFQSNEMSRQPTSLVVARTPGERSAMNVYAASKAAAWQFCQMYALTKGWPIRGCMIFQAYGPGQWGSALIPAAIRAAKRDENFPMTNGTQVRDWIHVKDVARGLVSTLQAPLNPGTTVELGTGHGTSVAEVVSLIFERSNSRGRPQPGRLPNRPGEDSRQVADISLAQRLTGWQAQIALHEGLDQLIGPSE